MLFLDKYLILLNIWKDFFIVENFWYQKIYGPLYVNIGIFTYIGEIPEEPNSSYILTRFSVFHS